MNLTDTHCHLDMHQFDEDRKQVIEKAIESGIKRMLIPGIDLYSSRMAVKLTENYSEVFASVGVHPNSADGWNSRTLTELKILSDHNKVVAIGEIGLDYFRDSTPRDKQQQIFSFQLDLALDRALPVIIHNRDATSDVLKMLSEWYYRASENNSILVGRPGVLHSFSGNIEDVNRAAVNGFYFGITGPVTYKNANELRQVVKMIDIDKVIIETDSPYLSPHPLRGMRNEPINVRHIAEKIATIRKIDFDELVNTTYSNAERLFQW